MSLRTWFADKRQKQKGQKSETGHYEVKDETFEQLWVECYNCTHRMLRREFLTGHGMCTECGYHFRINSTQRIEQLADAFEVINDDLVSTDPLVFTDTEPYHERIAKAEVKSNLYEAIITGIATTNGTRFALGVMDFDYMGGSMGSVVGEKITRLIEVALEQKLSLVIVSASGGARMQEGIFSLMQMVKTGAALGRFHVRGQLFISVLTEPTFGGVTASFGTLGDIIIAEEGSRIGFAGRRVIEQTIRQKLPADFQTANYLLKYGQVDMVVKRPDLRQTLVGLISVHEKSLKQAGPFMHRQPAMA
ncbi:MAG: acetyl-CoA carboxylase carboxyltransferase subunit beta [Cyanobacteria bacterium HKST-UBA03]|nr:acetyl-CoA carboxylase carboxyltransferase subunit beta [Cyanobacteria bacterium HKST-UBA03]